MKLVFGIAVPACFLSASMLVASGPAHAESDIPLRLTLSETLMHDNNVFRRATAPVADTTTSTSVGLILDKTLSRQTLHAEISGTANRYQRLNQLDNDGSNIRVSWQGSFPKRISASATFSRTESASSFADRITTQKNIVTATDAGFGLAYAIHPDLSISANFGHGTNSNSSTTDTFSDVDTDSGQLGIQYVSRLGNSIGLSTRVSRGHYLNQPQIISSDYEQKDTLVNLIWAPGIRSHLGFHGGRTKRELKYLPQGGFTGSTGGMNFDWAINSKTSFNMNTGREVTAQDFSTAKYAIVRRTGFGVAWTPTSKITTSLAYDRQQRDFSAGGAPTDTTNATTLSIVYSPHEKIHFSMQMRHEIRDSDLPTFEYDATVASVSAQVSF